jgi:hypothetical protein
MQYKRTHREKGRLQSHYNNTKENKSIMNAEAIKKTDFWKASRLLGCTILIDQIILKGKPSIIHPPSIMALIMATWTKHQTTLCFIENRH